MNNLADIIEKWILDKLSCQQNQIIILRRNEIAGILNCAPSQVSYVLTTRFTTNRGFLVESRRGLGGFVKIARMPFNVAGEEIDDMNLTQMEIILERLRNNNLLTQREALILARCAEIICKYAEARHHSTSLKSLLLSLNSNYST
jgi:transcriptional regulator CtsR